MIFRSLLRNKPYAAAAAATLALGIGGTAAVFSVFHSILIRPLPYENPERLVWVHNEYRGNPSSNSPPDYFDRVERSRTMESLAAFDLRSVNLTGQGQAERLEAVKATASFFPLLGVAPRKGRVFTEAEDQVGSERVAVLDHGFWQRRFGGDPGVVGERIVLDGAAHEVLGVMPSDFGLPEGAVEVYLPLALTERHKQDSQRGNEFLSVLGRLSPGATLEQAEAEMDAIAASVIERVPERAEFLINARWSAQVEPFRERYVAGLRPTLSLLLAAVGCLLLIACVNVANLQFARASTRRRELAVRSALGASPRDLMGRLLGESLLLSAAGGVIGVGLAWAALRWLLASAPSNIPLIGNAGLHWPVLGASGLLVVLSAALSGLLPAWRLARGDLAPALHEAGRGAGGGGYSLRRGLVAGEIALAVVLLAGAGLLLRSFQALLDNNPGFESQGRLAASFSLPAGDYPQNSQREAFMTALLEKLQAQPGVSRAGATHLLPLAAQSHTSTFHVDGYQLAPGENPPGGEYRVVAGDLIQALGIPLLEGRDLRASDDANAPLAVLVNKRLADRYWPQGALGQRLRFGRSSPWRTVVGVVGNVRNTGLSEEPDEQIYIPYRQSSHPRNMSLVLHTRGDPLRLAQSMRAAVRRLDSNVPLYRVETFQARVSRSLAPERYPLLLLACFALLGLTLAAVGVYGVVAFFVGQRTREIGIRVALGGRPRDIRRLVLRQGLTLAAAGLLAGLAAAAALSSWLSRSLHGVSALDPLALGCVALVILAVAAAQCYLPARRATRLDAVMALRSE